MGAGRHNLSVNVWGVEEQLGNHLWVSATQKPNYFIGQQMWPTVSCEHNHLPK